MHIEVHPASTGLHRAPQGSTGLHRGFHRGFHRRLHSGPLKGGSIERRIFI